MSAQTSARSPIAMVRVQLPRVPTDAVRQRQRRSGFALNYDCLRSPLIRNVERLVSMSIRSTTSR